MKTSLIPAEITSVEDKIVGSLSYRQIVILSLPLFMSMVIYILLPPFVNFSQYKYILLILVSVLISSLAIRIEQKILLDWIRLFINYRNRPRIYVFKKEIPNKIQKVDVTDNINQTDLLNNFAKRIKTASYFNTRLIAKHNYKELNSDLIYKVGRRGDLNVFVK